MNPLTRGETRLGTEVVMLAGGELRPAGEKGLQLEALSI